MMTFFNGLVVEYCYRVKGGAEAGHHRINLHSISINSDLTI